MLFYTTDCGDGKEDLGRKLQQRSVSLVSRTKRIRERALDRRTSKLEKREGRGERTTKREGFDVGRRVAARIGEQTVK